jgi:hypothetical protein
LVCLLLKSWMFKTSNPYPSICSFSKP